MKLEVALIALCTAICCMGNSVVSGSVIALQKLVQKNYKLFWVYHVSSFLISGYTISSVWKNCKWEKLGFFFYLSTEKRTRRPSQLFVLLLISGHILLYSLAWWQIHVCLKNSSTFK